MQVTIPTPRQSPAVIQSSSSRTTPPLPAFGGSPDARATDAAGRLGHSFSASAAAPIQRERNRKRWTPQQRAQSQKFWEKKNKKLEARRENQDTGFLRRAAVARRDQVAAVGQRGVVAGPAGAQGPMALRVGVPVAPNPLAAMGYRQVMSSVTDFLHPNHPVRSLHNAGGPQFVQQFNQHPTAVTRRVGIDVEPSAHVNQLRPHINLQTQHDGVIQGGPLADPHHPVLNADPFGVNDPVHGLHPLRGMQPEEQRRFMERHLLSSGINVARP